jgi:hypothetical protein
MTSNVTDKDKIIGLVKNLAAQIIHIIAPALHEKFVRITPRIYNVNHYKIRDGF